MGLSIFIISVLALAAVFIFWKRKRKNYGDLPLRETDDPRK